MRGEGEEEEEAGRRNYLEMHINLMRCWKFAHILF